MSLNIVNSFVRKKVYLLTYLLTLISVSAFYRKNKYSKALNGYVHGTSTEPRCKATLVPNDGMF